MDTPLGSPARTCPRAPRFMTLTDPSVPPFAPALPQALSNIDHSGFQSRSRPQHPRSLRIPSPPHTSGQAPQAKKHSRSTSFTPSLVQKEKAPAVTSALGASRRVVSRTASRAKRKNVLEKMTKPSTIVAADLFSSSVSTSHNSRSVNASMGSGEAAGLEKSSSGSSTMLRRTSGRTQMNEPHYRVQTSTLLAERKICKNESIKKHRNSK